MGTAADPDDDPDEDDDDPDDVWKKRVQFAMPVIASLHPFEGLDPLAAALNHLDVDTHGVARPKRGNIVIITEFLDLLLVDLFNDVHRNSPTGAQARHRSRVMAPPSANVQHFHDQRGRKDVPAGGLAKCRRWYKLRGAGRGGGPPRRRPFTATARPPHTCRPR